jgi:carbonic anhydrase
MRRLIEGYQHFAHDLFPERRDHFKLLSDRQSPRWLFITCSDSRVVPDLILQTEPGDLFIARNAGNVVPAESHGSDDGVAATIEYAVEVLKVKHIILCGHSDCGALKAALDHVALEQLPKARLWLSHVQDAFKYKQPLNSADGPQAELASLIRGNVVAQLRNLRTQPSVLHALSENRLQLHGWYYDILSGRVERYDEGAQKFSSVVNGSSSDALEAQGDVLGKHLTNL